MELLITGEYITIGQLLKKFNYVTSGGQVKHFLANNSIKINGKKPLGRNTKVFLNATLWINDDVFKIISKN